MLSHFSRSFAPSPLLSAAASDPQIAALPLSLTTRAAAIVPARELFLKYRDAPAVLLPHSVSCSPTMVEKPPSANPANEPPRIETDAPAEFPKPVRTDTVDTSNDVFFEATEEQDQHAPMERLTLARSGASYMSKLSTNSVPPPGSILTGKQEHCVQNPPGPCRVAVLNKLQI